MKKKLLSVLLAGAMAIATLAGCGAATEEGGEAGFNGKFDETQKIIVKFLNVTPLEEGANADVVAAINELSKEKVNVEIDFQQIFIADYITKAPTEMAAGEACDIVMFTAIPSSGFVSMVSQKQLTGITQEQMDTYAPDIQGILGNYLSATTINDLVYGFPAFRQYDSSMYLMMRKDILNELGLLEKAEAVETWADVEEIFAAVKAQVDAGGFACEDNKSIGVFGPTDNQGTMLTPGLTVCGGDKIGDAINFDALGDQDKFLYVDSATDTVKCIFEQDFYLQAMNRVNDWQKKGYIYNENYENNAGDTGMGAGLFFSYLSTGEYGQEAKKSSVTQKDLLAINICPAVITSDMVYRWGYGIPSFSENVEAALVFLNLMYTDADIENLFSFGIEGTNYNLADDGGVIVDYSKGYFTEDFLYANQFNALPLAGQGASFRSDALNAMNNTELSKYFGCIVDTTDVANQVSQVRDVLASEQIPMEAGMLEDKTPEEQIATLIEKCNAVGMQDIIDFYQATLDAYLGK